MADAMVTTLIRPHMSEGERTIWDVNGKYMLKHQPSERVIKIAQLLADEGIPVARYLPMTNGNFTTDDGYALMTKITGMHPNLFEQPYLAMSFGRELGILHIALARIEPQLDGLHNSNFLDQLHNYVLPGLGERVPTDLLDDFVAKMEEICPTLPCQLIHRDVHCQNVLFDGDRLSGWLDFDLNHKNTRLFDIAYLLAYLIFGNQNNPEKVEAWQQICDEVMIAYNEVNPMTDIERNALPLMMTAVELLFVAFWSCEGNEEQCQAALDLAQWLWQRKWR